MPGAGLRQARSARRTDRPGTRGAAVPMVPGIPGTRCAAARCSVSAGHARCSRCRLAEPGVVAARRQSRSLDGEFLSRAHIKACPDHSPPRHSRAHRCNSNGHKFPRSSVSPLRDDTFTSLRGSPRRLVAPRIRTCSTCCCEPDRPPPNGPQHACQRKAGIAGGHACERGTRGGQSLRYSRSYTILRISRDRRDWQRPGSLSLATGTRNSTCDTPLCDRYGKVVTIPPISYARLM